ncbi:MAG: hypothetical protein J7K53_03815, partial [Bacteroidales bacterium]|nr:hypothetical protein [Bacteroidales bacterium]
MQHPPLEIIKDFVTDGSISVKVQHCCESVKIFGLIKVGPNIASKSRKNDIFKLEKNKMKKVLMCIFFLLLMVSISCAANPVLYFSDITSGPKTELEDGFGSGAIVTVWGANLGSSQGTSGVYVGNVKAAYVYEWTDATQHPGHPADLYTYHKMQTIAFSVPSGVSDGPNTIKVVVNGVDSNTLPFTVRPGSIYFVKATANGGSDSNPGTWERPWATPDYYTKNAGGGKANPGSICYVLDGTWNTPLVIGTSGQLQGTLANPYAIIAYPGQNVVVNSSETYNFASYYNDDWAWTISKFKLTGRCNIVGSIKWGRYIGLEVTDHPTLSCVANQTGGFLGGGSNNPSDPVHSIHTDGIVIYGNYMHDYCIGNTNSQQHTFYMSNRIGYAIAPFDIGWNYLKDNQSDHGLHVYDEGVCGGWTGTCKIHHNVVVSQRGVGIGIGGGCASGWGPWDNTFEVDNNLLIDCGRGPAFASGQCPEIAMAFGGNVNAGFDNADYHIKAYNNIIYGYGENVLNEGGSPTIGAISVNHDFGSIDFKNNIIADTKNKAFYINQGVDPTYHSNNIWYNGGDGQPVAPPAWDTSWTHQTSNPLFMDAANGNFSLQSDSPCKDNGTSTVSAVVKIDIDGISRPQGDEYDVGAYEYNEGGPPPPIDDEDPVITITNPTTASEYETPLATISLAGTASDNVAVQSVTWTQNGGHPQNATGTTDWSIPSFTLVEGANNIVVTATDTSGNTASDTIVINYTKPVDDEDPVITITNPTTASEYETPLATISLAGTASDNVALQSVTWTQNGGQVQNAIGTTDWSIPSFTLVEGANNIVVTATDTSGNTASDTIVINYTKPQGTYTEIFGNVPGSDHPRILQD